jgi:hypothetical protein
MAYEIQTRKYQIRTLTGGGWDRFKFVPALKATYPVNGMKETLAIPLSYPSHDYIPTFKVVNKDPRRNAMLNMFMWWYDSMKVYPTPLLALLLPKRETDYLSSQSITLYEWPDLVVDKVCHNCAGIFRGIFDIQEVCCI